MGCLVHSIFDAKCLQVYFTLSPDNFIFGDLAMLLACGTCHLYLRMPVLFMCWITTESVRSLEEHTRKKKLEINLRNL